MYLLVAELCGTDYRGLTVNRVFHKLDEIGNNANIGIRGFPTWKKIQ